MRWRGGRWSARALSDSVQRVPTHLSNAGRQPVRRPAGQLAAWACRRATGSLQGSFAGSAPALEGMGGGKAGARRKERPLRPPSGAQLLISTGSTLLKASACIIENP